MGNSSNSSWGKKDMRNLVFSRIKGSTLKTMEELGGTIANPKLLKEKAQQEQANQVINNTSNDGPSLDD